MLSAKSAGPPSPAVPAVRTGTELVFKITPDKPCNPERAADEKPWRKILRADTFGYALLHSAIPAADDTSAVAA